MDFGNFDNPFRKSAKDDTPDQPAPVNTGMGAMYSPMPDGIDESPSDNSLSVGQKVRVYEGERARQGILHSKEDSGNYVVKLTEGNRERYIIRPPQEIEDLAKVKKRGMRITIGRG